MVREEGHPEEVMMELRTASYKVGGYSQAVIGTTVAQGDGIQKCPEVGGSSV